MDNRPVTRTWVIWWYIACIHWLFAQGRVLAPVFIVGTRNCVWAEGPILLSTIHLKNSPRYPLFNNRPLAILFSFLGVHDFMYPHIPLASSSPLPFPLFCFPPLFTFLFYPSHIHTSVVDSQSGLSSPAVLPDRPTFWWFRAENSACVCKRPYDKVLFMRLSAGWFVNAGHRVALTVELWSSNTQWLHRLWTAHVWTTLTTVTHTNMGPRCPPNAWWIDGYTLLAYNSST